MIDTPKTDVDAIINSIKESEKPEICINYISDFSTTKIIRNILWEICDIYNLSFIVKTRLILLVDELNNNAIEYWSKDGEINKFIFILEEDKNNIKINIEVTDTWNWIQAKKAIDMEKIKEQRLKKWFEWHLSIRGRWLFMIIEKIADKLYFKDDKNGGLTVWVELNIKRD